MKFTEPIFFTLEQILAMHLKNMLKLQRLLLITYCMVWYLIGSAIRSKTVPGNGNY